MKKQFLLEVLKHWIPLAVAITLVCGIIYVLIQQVYRLDANDPQIQYADDISNALEQGTTADQIVGQNKVDISKSLDVFVILYNSNKTITATSAVIGDSSPTIPDGVLDKANAKGDARVTWQPQKGVRLATVTKKYKDGYVVVGRSLKEVEKRITQLSYDMLIGWAVGLVGTLFTVIAVRLAYNRLKK